MAGVSWTLEPGTHYCAIRLLWTENVRAGAEKFSKPAATGTQALDRPWFWE